jgi:hypothetical protein
MLVRRAALLLATGCTAALIVAVALGARSGIGPSERARMLAGSDYLDSAAVAARRPLAEESGDTQLLLSLMYAERIRLGMGSPFRTIEQAARDPRLSPKMREMVGWGLVGRLVRGDGYQVDPSVLDDASPGRWRENSGAAHLALIEEAVTESDDPRTGEVAVRLAYALGVTEGVVRGEALRIARDAAAQIRDRELARRDIRLALSRTRQSGATVFAEIARARADLDFSVERPLMSRQEAARDEEAVDRAGSLLVRLRELASSSAEEAADADRPITLLVNSAADRVMEIGQSLPPQSAVVIRITSESPMLRAAAAAGRLDADIVRSAYNDEMLVGAMAAVTRDGVLPRAMSRLLLSTAVALRAGAQEPVWFPGDSGPSALEVSAAHGLRELHFAPAVRAAWRPYYLRMVASALDDMGQVFPSYSTRGLRITIEDAVLPDGALAMHDPRTRTIRLTTRTSAGALAHELAHDLDWTAARQLFGSAGGYSTDRAVSHQRGSLASSMHGLAPHAEGIAVPAGLTGAKRPTEVFARNVEWFVATTLAATGRSNSYLSGIQDPVLAGATAGTPTALGRRGATALADALGQMTFLSQTVSRSFAREWSDPQSFDLAFLLGRVLALPIGDVDVATDPPPAFSPLVSADVAPACLVASGRKARPARARDALITMAVDSRARGLASRQAKQYDRETRPEWAKSLLHEAPWADEMGERAVARMRAAVRMTLARDALDVLGFSPTVPLPFEC